VETRTAASTPNVLVVDDDPMLVDVISEKLRDAGYTVRQAGTATEAASLYERQRPDLVVLDLMLPDADGLTLCARLSANASVPIVVVSGTRRDRDRLLAFQLGADDFLAKPFDLDELEARVGAVLRRSGRVGGTTPARGNYALDEARLAIVSGREAVLLTPIEFRLLTALIERVGQVVTRVELAEEAWGRVDLASSRTIDAHLRRLRTKLARGPAWAPTVVVVHGRGYLLEP
jgi:two-component system response regulator MtrA